MKLPVLSAQLITAPTGRPSEMRNLAPAEPPRPDQEQRKHLINNYCKCKTIINSLKSYNCNN